ncbi:MAG: hypothetical protein NT025_05980 [bacterium]|nr:hypothetical protein [bacterium]
MNSDSAEQGFQTLPELKGILDARTQDPIPAGWRRLTRLGDGVARGVQNDKRSEPPWSPY